MSAFANLAAAGERSAAAAARIRDADLAAESTNLVRSRILEQARVAVLAQANQRAGIVLDLLV